MCKQFQCLIIVGEVLYCKQHITATCFECLVLCLPCNITHTLQYCVNIHACVAYSVHNTRYFLLKLAILHKSIKKLHDALHEHHLASGIQCTMLLVSLFCFCETSCTVVICNKRTTKCN